MRLLNDAHRPLRGSLIFWLILFSLLPASVPAKSPNLHPPELEQAVSRSSLILVARVDAVRETTVVAGGKAKRVIRAFDFKPVKTLKGLFVREMLSLTSDDLHGSMRPATLDSVWTLRTGDLRLMLLGRSGIGYRNVHPQRTLDQSLPVLESVTDPLVTTVELLIALTQEPDRARKIEMLLKSIETADGPAAVPLLESLAYRALLAAQHPGVVAVTRLLRDPSPQVRTAAARTLGAILEADYLAHGGLSERAVEGLLRMLQTSDPFVAARVAAFEAIGAARSQAARDLAARRLRLEQQRNTWAEGAALIRAIGRQQIDAFTDPIRALAEELRLDADHGFSHAVQTALIQLAPARAVHFLEGRIKAKHQAGLDAALEIQLAGELPGKDAVSVLMIVPVERLSVAERIAFATACREIKDERIVPALAMLLEPRVPQVHRQAVEALRNIDTLTAAQALLPYLAQEANLVRKLEIAAFLGRHGIDAGAAYALEHMSQPHLLEPSIAVLVAGSSPDTVKTLREIVTTSNDIAWTGAAIRALGALNDRELAPQLFNIVADLRHPLAPYALVALGALGEPRAVAVYREGVRSRDDGIVVASIRGAAGLMKRKGVDDQSLRDEIAALLAGPDASDEVRAAALDALGALEDLRLDSALAEAAFDGRLEGKPLLGRIEELLEERKIRLESDL